MPVINLINFPFADGAVPTGTDVSAVFYLPAPIPVSLEGINGWLDKDNADTTAFTEVTYDQVQRNSFHYAGVASGTANLDYFDTWYKDVQLWGTLSAVPCTPLTYLDRFKVIPGGAQTFYLPYDCLVIFSWTVGWGNDSRVGSISSEDSRTIPGADTIMAFFVDDTHVSGQLRQASRSIYYIQKAGLGAGYDLDELTKLEWDLEDNVHMGMVKNRFWHGHHTVQMTKGWHSASLRVLGCGFGHVEQFRPQENTTTTFGTGDDGDKKFKYRAQRQSRVWARSLRYVAFRHQSLG